MLYSNFFYMKKLFITAICVLMSTIFFAQSFSYDNPLMNNNYTIPVAALDGTTVCQDIQYTSTYNTTYSSYASPVDNGDISGSVTSSDGKVVVYYTIEYVGGEIGQLLGMWKITWILPNGTKEMEYLYLSSENRARSEAQSKGLKYANDYAKRVPIGDAMGPMLFAIAVYALYVYLQLRHNNKNC